MRFASVAEVKNQLSEYLGRARRKKESIIVTHHGKPYALIHRSLSKIWRSWSGRSLRRNDSAAPGKGTRMPSTTTYKRGQVVVANVPFSNHSGSKPRPALVISTEAFHRTLLDVIVCPISSRPRYYQRPGPGDQPLRHWKDVGLRYPSTVRLSNILAVDKKIIKRSPGRLLKDDLEHRLCRAGNSSDHKDSVTWSAPRAPASPGDDLGLEADRGRERPTRGRGRSCCLVELSNLRVPHEAFERAIRACRRLPSRMRSRLDRPGGDALTILVTSCR